DGAHGVNWSGATLLAPFDFDPTPVGTPVAGGLEDIRPGQIHFPAAAIIANNGNPIPVWEVTYTATDFSTDRTVDLDTVTERFDAYLSATLATSETVTAGLEGAGSFRVLAQQTIPIIPETSTMMASGLAAVLV